MTTILIYEIRFTADRSIAERFRYWSEKTVNDRGFLIHPRVAEAALKAGDTSAAAGYMNTLRKNRIENYTDVASITLDDILLERRLELFTEGHTAWDAWRNGKSVNNKFVGEVKPGDYRTIMAIPIGEITVSRGQLIQNPGY